MKIFLIIATTIAFTCIAQADEPATGPSAASTEETNCHAAIAVCTSLDCLMIDDEIAYDEEEED